MVPLGKMPVIDTKDLSRSILSDLISENGSRYVLTLWMTLLLDIPRRFLRSAPGNKPTCESLSLFHCAVNVKIVKMYSDHSVQLLKFQLGVYLPNSLKRKYQHMKHTKGYQGGTKGYQGGTKGYQGIPRGTKGYQGGTKGYQGVSRDTKSYQGIPRDTKGYHGIPTDIRGIAKGYQGLSN